MYATERYESCSLNRPVANTNNITNITHKVGQEPVKAGSMLFIENSTSTTPVFCHFHAIACSCTTVALHSCFLPLSSLIAHLHTYTLTLSVVVRFVSLREPSRVLYWLDIDIAQPASEPTQLDRSPPAQHVAFVAENPALGQAPAQRQPRYSHHHTTNTRVGRCYSVWLAQEEGCVDLQVEIGVCRCQGRFDVGVLARKRMPRAKSSSNLSSSSLRPDCC
jgi:hypothetical protein